MSLKIEGSSCARCKAYLFSDDDIVYCPECGAPHHRDCYNALGHCALETLHGTEDEYSREKEIEALEEIKKRESQAESKDDNIKVCHICSERYSANEKFCPKCKTPELTKINGFEGFDFLGGVPSDYLLDDDVTADDAKRFVIANTQRYIPKFAALNKQNKISWNWIAFLFPSGWMLARKMYKSGIIVGLLTVLFTILTFPFRKVLYAMGIEGSVAYTELLGLFGEISNLTLIFTFLGTLLDLALRIVTALFGDYFYKSHTIAQIKKIKAESVDINYDYRKKGGVNLIYFFLSSLVLQYLTTLVFYFF